MTTRDSDLLDVLAASLGPPPEAEPTWAEISHLHRVIDTAADVRSRRARTPLSRLRQPIAAAAAGVLLLGGASAAAAVSGAVMPQPVRVAARAVGLPVDSPDLAGARAALARLRDVLADKPRDLNAIRIDAQDVRDRLGRLSADDRSHVEDEAAFLLAAADAALAPPPAQLGSPPASQSPVHPAPGGPAAPAADPAPSGDDHGGGSGPSATPEGSGSEHGQSGDDRGNSSATPNAGNSGPGPSGSSGDAGQTATTIHTDNPGHGSTDGGTNGSQDGGSQDGGGGHSGSDGGPSSPD